MRIREGTTIAGRYRLRRALGHGGMSVVWLAEDERLGREVAIKLLSETLLADPDFVERFEREARIAAGLSHPNLVSIHDRGVEDDRPFLIMEYVEGPTLAERIEHGSGSIDLDDLARSLLETLAAIHAAGIVHRDIKPANVLYDASDRVRLTDFGIARLLDSTRITKTGQVLGTLDYMAPEVRSGSAPSARSDLYSLGVLLEKSGVHGGQLGELAGGLRAADPDQRPADARTALDRLEADPGPASRGRLPAEVLGGEPTDAPTDVPARTDQRATEEVETRPPNGRQPAPTPPPFSAGDAETFRGGRPSLPALAGIGALVVAILAVIVIASGSGSGEDPGAGTRAEQGQTGDGGQPTPPAEPAPDPAAADTPIDPQRGSELNDQGYALLQAGDPGEAVPILQQAVASYPEDSDDLTYAFALFNLARALRLSGDPESAIPLLQERLRFDNQRDVVRAELKQAKADAGES